MTKPKETEITYNTAGGKVFTETVELPLGHHRGENIINKAEANGCTDIEAVREQVRKLY